MEEKNEIITIQSIRDKVYYIRSQQVMLDQDLAKIYGYEVKRLNEQVKRNISRFPEDFMFQLLPEEVPLCSKSQNATLNVKNNKRGTNIKKMPYAFTEHGIYMLATVLKGELAEKQSVFIMRAFKELRHFIRQNQQFVTSTEMELLSAKLSHTQKQITEMKEHQSQTDQKLENIWRSIDSINENFISDNDYKNFIIYKGQKIEADMAYIDIYRQAKKLIYVVDDYVNTKTLQLLSQKGVGVEVILFTENGHGRNGFLTTSVVSDFQNEYPTLRIKHNPDCHDRLIVLDYGLPTEKVFHCGASSKDAGNKLCAINAISDINLIHPAIDKLLLGSDYAV